jgi:hypothetical protein
MASIKISELRPLGSELFQDQESFLNELSDRNEIDQVVGGRGRLFIGFSLSAQTIIGNTVNANTAGNVNTVLLLG